MLIVTTLFNIAVMILMQRILTVIYSRMLVLTELIVMAHFHQRRRTRIRIQIPNPIITLYYAQLFPLVRIWIWIPVWIVFRMVTVPILGTDFHPRDTNPNPSSLVEMSLKRDKMYLQ